MAGLGLYTNKKIKNDRNLRWRSYFIDFHLTNKFHPKIAAHVATWQPSFQFNAENRATVPNVPGIYLFFVKPSVQVYPEQSFILYVGRSMNLYNRYGDYLTTYKNSDEPNHLERRLMLNAWEAELQYTYFTLAGYTEIQVEKIEKQIIDSLVPPINRSFANATIKQQVRINR
jgi:hypothetical protein